MSKTQSYLVFDFGTNEEVAQQARHRLESWRQAFHLGDKMTLKFERTSPEKKNGGEKIRILVKLYFSDHEKLSHQRWVDRIPTEEPFKGASPQVLHASDAGFGKMEELFDALE